MIVTKPLWGKLQATRHFYFETTCSLSHLCCCSARPLDAVQLLQCPEALLCALPQAGQLSKPASKQAGTASTATSGKHYTKADKHAGAPRGDSSMAPASAARLACPWGCSTTRRARSRPGNSWAAGHRSSFFSSCRSWGVNAWLPAGWAALRKHASAHL